MGKNDITLHKEHGLNPTLAVCIVCGEPTGEIAILGAAYKGKAPTYAAVSPFPCDKCMEAANEPGHDWAFLLETEEDDDHVGPVNVDKAHFTGRVLRVSRSFFNRAVSGLKFPEKRICFITKTAFGKLSDLVSKLRAAEDEGDHLEEATAAREELIDG